MKNVLLGILLLGAFLRFHTLGRQSLWVDEAYTWGVVVNTTWLTVWKSLLVVSDVSPLSYVITKLCAPLLGTHEFGLRLPSAMTGWLAIAATYRLGRVMFGQTVGVLASAFIAASPFAVWYSQDARSYGLYLLLSAGVLGGFWRAERGRGWGMFILASMAMYLTQYVSALFVYAQVGYILTQLRRQPLLFRKWALAQMVAVIPVVGWVLGFLSLRQPITANTWIPRVTLLTPLNTIWNFVSGDVEQWAWMTALGAVVMIGLMGWGARPFNRTAQLLWWWLILPLVTGWVFSLRLPAYIDRFFEPALLSVALLTAAGLSRLPMALKTVSAVLLALVMLSGTFRLYSDPVFEKENWRAATRQLEADGLRVGLPDAEALLGIAPYMSSGLRPRLIFARDVSDLNRQWAEGPFVLVLRSPHDSAHALSKSTPFDPLSEGPVFFKLWRMAHSEVPLKVDRFTGLALVAIGR
jgi:uncharacterized membrane protein